MSRMEGIGGQTVDSFSEVDQLSEMLGRCKGETAFNGAVYEALKRLAVHADAGKLPLDWM